MFVLKKKIVTGNNFRNKDGYQMLLTHHLILITVVAIRRGELGPRATTTILFENIN